MQSLYNKRSFGLDIVNQCHIKRAAIIVLQHPDPQLLGPGIGESGKSLCAGYGSVRGPHLAQHPSPH